jgi:hypothetical protein
MQVSGHETWAATGLATGLTTKVATGAAGENKTPDRKATLDNDAIHFIFETRGSC